jgi:inner membrane protein
METIVQNVWTKSKLLIKALIIGVLALLLLIPTFYVQELIREREDRQKDAIAEVSSKWAAQQTITGPVVVLPFWQEVSETNKAMTRHLAYFLPDELTVSASLTPQEKYRGIYKVMLYTANSKLRGSFVGIDPAKLRIPAENIIWTEAYVQLNVSDMKGLNDVVKFKWNNQLIELAPNADQAGQSLAAPLNITGIDDLKKVDFETDINLSGSDQLLFSPIGKSTTVNLSSSWPHPSFTGDILPQSTSVKDSGFNASWKSMAHKRNFPQQWKDDAFALNTSGTDAQVAGGLIQKASFGTSLFVPVNSYQKIERSVKYAILCILLTFAAFFLIETVNKKSVHPFQYGLIGLALVLFYTLLLSFSEYIGFDFSYAIASVATIGLIAWFVKGILTSGRLSLILSAVLLLMYTYVFTILQLRDYSLLFGSIGLFITLAVIMHFSKKIQW